jgi:hypothetical protein
VLLLIVQEDIGDYPIKQVKVPLLAKLSEYAIDWQFV